MPRPEPPSKARLRLFALLFFVAALLVWLWLRPKTAIETTWSLQVQAERSYVSSGEEISLAAVITPAQGGIELDWSSDAGTISGAGERVRWRAPETSQTVLVTAVGERAGIRRTASARIVVWTRTKRSAPPKIATSEFVPPRDLEVDITKTEICKGEQTFFTARARNGTEGSDREIFIDWALTQAPNFGVSPRRVATTYGFMGPPEDSAPGTYVWKVRATEDGRGLHRGHEQGDENAAKGIAEKTFTIQVRDCEEQKPPFTVGIVRENPYMFTTRFDIYDIAEMRKDGPAKNAGDPREYMDTPLVRSIRKYEWDFGDKTRVVTTRAGHVVHEFRPARTDRAHYGYVVKVKMTRNDGTTAEKTDVFSLMLYDPNYPACGFEVALGPHIRDGKTREWAIELAIHNASPVNAFMDQVTLPHSQWRSAFAKGYRTLPATKVMSDTIIPGGGEAFARVVLREDEMPEDDAPAIRISGKDDNGRICAAAITLARFEGEIYEIPAGKPLPNFIEEGLSPEVATAKLERWREKQLEGKRKLIVSDEPVVHANAQTTPQD